MYSETMINYALSATWYNEQNVEILTAVDTKHARVEVGVNVRQKCICLSNLNFVQETSFLPAMPV